MSLLRLIFVSVSLSLVACSSKPERPEIPERSNAERGLAAKAPITQARQTLNLNPDQAYRATTIALQRRRVGISAVDGPSGRIETDWVSMTDRLCSGNKVSPAPLSCRTRYSIKIEPYGYHASAVNIRYLELCAVNEEVSLACPDSSAEQLLLSIIEDIKTIDANFEETEQPASSTPSRTTRHKPATEHVP